MRRRIAALMVGGVAALVLPTGPVGAEPPPAFAPGASGVGDPYYPLDGNGGYDVQSYELDLRYDPATEVLTGTATIAATATQGLSSFDLDLVGLTVRSVTVDGKAATFSRQGQELVIKPPRGINQKSRFTVVVRYDGVPQSVDEGLGQSGFVATDDGFIVAGEPHGAAYWFPANDHPTDKASFDFEITVPAGLEAVANGKLDGQKTRNGWTTWEWEAKEPMATYLATANVGQFEIDAYRKDGIRFWDAIDSDLLKPVATPTTGTRFALAGQANSSYQRLARTIHVPASGATVSFHVTRGTEPGWDFFFVEAHTVGQDDWTTLPDQNGHTSTDTGFSCAIGGWRAIHPFLAHYQTDHGDGTCSPTGTSGQWNAATGGSGPEVWQVTLPAGAARDVELSLSYASDEVVQGPGVFVDDVVVSTGEGSTSFEADADPLDGWTVPGPPNDSPGNTADWKAGTVADLPPSLGAAARTSFKRQPEILSFLSRSFGPYPFTTGGGIVDDVPLGFALETQTRPIYSSVFFSDPIGADSVVVHENAHQWYGDSLAVAQWKHIWLNEGFATYAEWLWSERESLGTAQETFDFFHNVIPDDDPFWSLPIGDPGAGHEFDQPVYIRGAMTLQALRLTVGDDAFFRILRQWARTNAGGNVTTEQFIALAEKESGQELSPLFDAWLFGTTKPAAPGAPAAATARTAAVYHRATAAVHALSRRLGQNH